MNTDTPEQTNDEPDATAREMEATFRRLVSEKKRAEESLLVCVVIFGFTLWLVGLILWLASGPPPFLVMVFFLFPPIFCLLVVLAASLLSWKEYKETVRSLSPIRDVKYVGSLLNALSFYRPAQSKKLINLLIILLPQLQASQGHLLNASHRRKLYAILTPGAQWYKRVHSKKLSLAILKALEQVGDENAIPHVERLALDNKNEEVRDAAEHCLVFLRQRVEEQSATDTLLRPSDSAVAAPETLLRASVARPDEQPATLLRANAAPDERHS